MTKSVPKLIHRKIFFPQTDQLWNTPISFGTLPLRRDCVLSLLDQIIRTGSKVTISRYQGMKDASGIV
jgi:hypothetical protein